MTDDLHYQSGFGNEFATEALPGALPRRPQLAAARAARPVRRADLGHGVHRAARRTTAASWLYRIRPGRRCTRPFRRIDNGRS